MASYGENQWIVESGVLKKVLNRRQFWVSRQIFDDFKLHLEFKNPKGSNSGGLSRGRYAVQITEQQGRRNLPS